MSGVIDPFNNETQSVQLGGNEGLTIENRFDAVSIYGNIDIKKDKRGLAAAKTLLQIAHATVVALEKESSLPEIADAPSAPKTIQNPFGGQ